MRILAMGLVCVALVDRAVLAGPFDATSVSADAQWVVHANLEQLNEAGITSLLFAELATEKAKRRLGEFREEYGFDPFADLRSVTVYGKGWNAEHAVALFRGSFDTNRLVALARASDSYTETGYEGHAVHGWIGVNRGRRERSYGCIAADGTVVISRSAAMVRLGVDVLDERKGSLDSTGGFSGQLSTEPTPFLGAAAHLKGAGQLCPKASVLRNASAGWFALLGDPFSVDAVLSLTAEDQTTATHIHGVIQGLVSFMALTAQEKPQLGELVQAMQVSLDGLSVRVELSCPMLQALGFLKEGIAKARARHDAVQR